MMTEEDALGDLRKSLQLFPHLLQLDIIMKVKFSLCKSILDRLQSERKQPTGYEDDLYKIDNFISLLYFRMGKREDALEANSLVRGTFPNNITALVNLAYMKRMLGYEFEANDVVKVLLSMEKHKENTIMSATSLAEHGYCLARITPRYYKLAVEYYEKAIKAVPHEFVWKFGCALSARRCLNMSKCLKMTTDELKEYCRKAFKHFSDITEQCDKPLLCARAWVQLGELCHLFQYPKYPLTPEIVNTLAIKVKHTSKQCFDKALETDEAKNDNFVLERCGKFLRLVSHTSTYQKTLLECHSFLRKAISLRPTSFSCDHIARILIIMAESEKKTTKKTSSRPSWPTGNTSGITNTRSHTTKSKMTHKFKQARYSPKEVLQLNREDDRVKDAMLFLEQSIEISEGCNTSAIQCLGVLYRQIGDPESAVEQFRCITSQTDASAFDKSNAYEQRGYCLLDMSQDKKHTRDVRERYRKESQMMMMLSIEQTSILVAGSETMGYNALKDLQALPTLKQLLSNDLNYEVAKKYADLCTRIGDHREALVFYEQLLQSNQEDLDVLSGIVRNLVCVKAFNGAQTCLRLLLCTTEGQRMVIKYPSLLYQVYLGSAKHLLTSGESNEDKHMIKFSCRNAFESKHGRISAEDDQAWDVFILDDPEQTEAESTTIQSWLKETCGLSVTRNDDEVHGGMLSFSAEVKLMTSSQCLIVVLGENVTKRQESLVAITQSNSSVENSMPSVIVPVLTTSRDLPVTLRGNMSVRMAPGQHSPDILLKCFMSLLGIDYDRFEWLS